MMNYICMLAFYHRELSRQAPQAENEIVAAEDIVTKAISEHQKGEAFMSPLLLKDESSGNSICGGTQRVAAIVTVVGILLGFVLTDSVPLIALAGSAALLLIEVYLRDGEGTRVLKHVDGPLLVMISSLSVVIAGARLTGAPDALYQAASDVFPSVTMDYETFDDVMLAMVFVTILSNLISNVPTVLLLAPMMQKSSTQLGWLCLAWVSTVAGNLTLVGSIANLIVAEKSAAKGVEMTFWAHFKFAFWSTLLVIFFGCVVLFYVVHPIFSTA